MTSDVSEDFKYFKRTSVISSDLKQFKWFQVTLDISRDFSDLWRFKNISENFQRIHWRRIQKTKWLQSLQVNSHDFRYFKWLHKYQKNLLISGEFKRIQVTSNISGDFRYFKWLRMFQKILNISRELQWFQVTSKQFKWFQVTLDISRDFSDLFWRFENISENFQRIHWLQKNSED